MKWHSFSPWISSIRPELWQQQSFWSNCKLLFMAAQKTVPNHPSHTLCMNYITWQEHSLKLRRIFWSMTENNIVELDNTYSLRSIINLDWTKWDNIYRTMHLDNVKIPFCQQMQLLLNISNVKIYIKISYIHSYMFRSTWTIVGELTLSLAKVTLL